MVFINSYYNFQPLLDIIQIDSQLLNLDGLYD